MKSEPIIFIHFLHAVDDDEDEDENSALTLDSLRRRRRRRGGVRSARVLDLCDGGGAGDGAAAPLLQGTGEGGSWEGEIKAHRAIRSFCSFLHGMF